MHGVRGYAGRSSRLRYGPIRVRSYAGRVRAGESVSRPGEQLAIGALCDWQISNYLSRASAAAFFSVCVNNIEICSLKQGVRHPHMTTPIITDFFFFRPSLERHAGCAVRCRLVGR